MGLDIYNYLRPRYATTLGALSCLIWLIREPALILTKHMPYNEQTLICMLAATTTALCSHKKKYRVFKWPKSPLYGFFLFSNYLLISLSMQLCPTDMYKCIICTWPLCTLLLSAIIQNKKHNRIAIVSSVVSYLAIACCYWDSWIYEPHYLIGAFTTFLSALLWSAFSVGFSEPKKFICDGFTGIFICCTFYCFILSLWSGTNLSLLSLYDISLLSITGITCVFIADIFWIYGVGLGNTALLVNFSYVFNVLSSLILWDLGMIKTAPSSIGALIIIIFNCIISIYINKKSARETPSTPSFLID